MVRRQGLLPAAAAGGVDQKMAHDAMNAGEEVSAAIHRTAPRLAEQTQIDLVDESRGLKSVVPPLAVHLS